MSDREQVIKNLVATPQWGELWARLGERAHWRCEYCGLPFLASIENYKSMQMDHVIPRQPGERNNLDNLAASCVVCNLFKRRFDPRPQAGASATREMLVAVAAAYIAEKRRVFAKQLERDRTIIGCRPSAESQPSDGMQITEADTGQDQRAVGF
jgi:HNH endonuclease